MHDSRNVCCGYVYAYYTRVLQVYPFPPKYTSSLGLYVLVFKLTVFRLTNIIH